MLIMGLSTFEVCLLVLPQIVLVLLIVTGRVRITYGRKPAPIVPTQWQTDVHRKLRVSLEEAVAMNDDHGLDAIGDQIGALTNASLADVLEDPGAYANAIHDVASAVDEDEAGDIHDALYEAYHYAVALNLSTTYPAR